MEIVRKEKVNSCFHQLGKIYAEEIDDDDSIYYLCSRISLEDKVLFILIDLSDGECVAQYDSMEELDKDNDYDIEIIGSFVVK
jgi:hypothetical protein